MVSSRSAAVTDRTKAKRGIRNLRITPLGFKVLRALDRGTYKVKTKPNRNKYTGRFK